MATRILIPHAVFGLDLGQSGDPSALAMVLAIETIVSPYSWFDASHPRQKTWQLTETRIFPLGTAYMRVAQQVQQRVAAFKSQYPTTPCTLVADATGLGRPTLEILHHEFTTGRQGPSIARLEGIVFTSGSSHNKAQHPTLPVDVFHIPKLDLIQNLLQAMESRQLSVGPGLEGAPGLKEQFQSLRYATNAQTGNTTIQVAAGRDSGAGHADLVMALALAVWRLRELSPVAVSPLPRRLPGF